MVFRTKCVRCGSVSGSEGVLFSSLPSPPDVGSTEYAFPAGSVCCGSVGGLHAEGVGNASLTRTSVPCRESIILSGNYG